MPHILQQEILQNIPKTEYNIYGNYVKLQSSHSIPFFWRADCFFNSFLFSAHYLFNKPLGILNCTFDDLPHTLWV